jgi:SAM-dependent methyltransferase
VKFNKLLANCMIYQNACGITAAANALAADGHPVDPDDLATIAPYITHTIRRFGDWILDLLPPEAAQQIGQPPGGVPIAGRGSSLAAMAESFDPVAHNRAAWDRAVDEGDEWTRPVGPDVVARARAGDWSVVLIGYQPVPRDWFPADLTGTAVLCLASGGGQQGPVLAAAGADVTVFDNSSRQLGRDEEVAARDGLAIRTVLGDMRDLSAFADGRFDLVFNPVSNVFCPDLAPVWRGCFRVLRPEGLLLTGFINPDLFIFDIEALDERAEFVVRHRIPFATTDLPDAERRRLYHDGPVEYSHTLTEQIGGSSRPDSS